MCLTACSSLDDLGLPGALSDEPTPQAATTTDSFDDARSGSGQGANADSGQQDQSRVGQDGESRFATVDQVSDGDSFTVTWVDGTSGEVRLVGLNSPEWGACHSQASRAALTSLLGTGVFEVDDVGTDRFGRTLAYVWVDDESVNLAMVDAGDAIASSTESSLRDTFQQAQARARQAGLGLWSADACIDEQSPLVFGEFEADPPGADNRVLADEWIEIVNVSSVVVELDGWEVRDESTSNRFEFDSGQLLDPGSSVRLRTGFGTNSTDDVYWNERYPVWNNGGDTAFLVKPDGRFGDVVTYGS